MSQPRANRGANAGAKKAAKAAAIVAWADSQSPNPDQSAVEPVQIAAGTAVNEGNSGIVGQGSVAKTPHIPTKIPALTVAGRRLWPRLFIKALRETGSLNKACAAAGIHYATVYRTRARDPRFDLRCKEAEQDFVSRYEDAVDLRAMNGVTDPGTGRLIFSDRLAELRL